VEIFEKHRVYGLIALILSIGAFFAVCFQILYRSINQVPIPSQIDYFILQSTIVIFLFGSFMLAKYRADGLKDSPVFTILSKSAITASVLALVMIPEYLYIFFSVRISFDAYTQIYLFLQVFLIHLYLVLNIFYFRRLLPVNLVGLKRIVWQAFVSLIIIAMFANFIKDFLPEFIRSFQVSMVFVLAVYLVFQLKWVMVIPPDKRLTTILYLVLLGTLNLFLVFHYYTEESHGFFNILSLPTEYYLCILFLPTLFSLISLLANIFYLPIAKVVEQKENEIRSLTKMSVFIQNKENLDGVFNFLLNNSVSDTESTAGWIILKNRDNKETLKSKNINIDRAIVITESFIANHSEVIKKKGYLTFLNTENLSPPLKGVGNFISLLAIEIELSKGETGKLFLVKEEEEGFDDYQIEMVKSYVAQANIAFENQRLFSESVKTESVKRELELASHIHKSLLPERFPQEENFEIAGFIEPSKELGGDFYDFFQLDNNKTAIVIGDVSGKGMPAALYMAEIKGIFQSLAQFNLSTKELILKANETISNCFDKSHFVTLAYVVIDKGTKKFTYVRCGHCPLLFYEFKTNNTEYFTDKGIGLGIIRSKSFENHIYLYEKEFHANDILVLYTDGFIEAIDKRTKKLFGFNEMKLSLETARKITAEDIKRDILNDFKHTVTLQENPDDLALIVIKFM
jgi:serine phosphatase RsbU (regulator of sigma subunit)